MSTSALPKCDYCGRGPATCYGSYENQPPSFACDECCGHGCEDGHCDLLEDEDELSHEQVQAEKEADERALLNEYFPDPPVQIRGKP